MKKTKLVIVLLAVLLMAAWVSAGGDEFIRTLSVTGQGKAMATPDLATILTGVVTESGNAVEAMAANNKAMEEILDILKTFKIAKKDVQTVHFNVSPRYKHDERGRRLPRIIGYRVTNQLRVKVHNLAELGKVLDALIRSGSNQVSGVDFGIGDPSNALKLARERAIADARNRAELYARAAGVRVGKVLTISEQAMALPRPQAMRKNILMERASDVPVEKGEQEFNARIHVTFEIADKP